MKIAIASDLHLEFGEIYLDNTENADVLVLAGDILIAQHLHDFGPDYVQQNKQALEQSNRLRLAISYRKLFDHYSTQFPHIIYIAGNHEFYHGKWHSSILHLKEEFARYPNVYFLEDQVKEIGGVLFVGSTLWTDLNGGDQLTKYHVRHSMSDFSVIRNDQKEYRGLQTEDVIYRHERSLGFIKNVVANTSKKVVVVSHHAPSELSVAECYKSQTLMNGAFRSNLDEFIANSPIIALWCHGHTHHPFDYMIGNTRVVCNPRGYVGYETGPEEFGLKYVDI